MAAIEGIPSATAHEARASRVGRWRAWAEERLLFGDLPAPARRLGRRVLAFGTPLVLAFGLATARPILGWGWPLAIAMVIAAYIIENRFWSIRGYGSSIDTVVSAIGIFGLVLNGPGFVLIYAALVAFIRWRISPWTAPYRPLFNFAVFGLGGSVSAVIIMILPPDVSHGLTLAAFVSLALAMAGQTIVSVPMASTMIGLAAGRTVKAREIAAEIVQIGPFDAMASAVALVALLAWEAGELPGLLLALTAVAIPGLLIMASVADDVWNEATLSAAAEGREAVRARALAGEIADEARAAYLDALTGLGNRQAFDAQMGAPSKRRVLVLADVVGLRAINDGIDHDTGDDLLRAAANGLRASIRGLDRAFRIGGDEFALVLEGLAPAGVEPFLRRVAARVTLEGQSIESLAGHPVRLRFGWAAGEGDLYARADQALTDRHAQGPTAELAEGLSS